MNRNQLSEENSIETETVQNDNIFERGMNSLYDTCKSDYASYKCKVNDSCDQKLEENKKTLDEKIKLIVADSSLNTNEKNKMLDDALHEYQSTIDEVNAQRPGSNRELKNFIIFGVGFLMLVSCSYAIRKRIN